MNRVQIIHEVIQNDEPTEMVYARHNLFLIKSKHAFKNYKNHDYFESRRNNTFSADRGQAREFVETPTPYGVNNAYRYICSEASKNSQLKSQIFKGKGEEVKGRSQTLKSEMKMRSTIFPNLMIQSRKVQESSSSLIPRSTVKYGYPKLEFEVTFLFWDRDSPMDKISNFQLKFNIFPSILNTFLKSKINYNQMTWPHFLFLKDLIFSIQGTQKQYVEYKDMVNIKTMREIFNYLQGNQKELIWKRELVRYYFIANPIAYEYQLEIIKDELKKMIDYQFNKDVTLNQLYIFDTETGLEITDLFLLMKLSGKYVFGVEKDVIKVYKSYIREKEAQKMMADRIKKWKSIVPDQKRITQGFKSLPQDKYHSLFANVQKKRDKWIKKKPVISLSRVQPFIERDKLYQERNIFQ